MLMKRPLLLFILLCAIHVLSGIVAFGLGSLTEVGHRFHYSKEGYRLRSPNTKAEWDAYHKIRIAEIHNKYCPELVYNYADPEEKLKTNFGFVFVDTSLPKNEILGVIRVDLLNSHEAAFRWVAITHELQRKGLGRRMLEVAERFVENQGRKLIRVPAEDDSKGFYEKLGYRYRNWPHNPKDAGNVPLAKEVR